MLCLLFQCFELVFVQLWTSIRLRRAARSLALQIICSWSIRQVWFHWAGVANVTVYTGANQEVLQQVSPVLSQNAESVSFDEENRESRYNFVRVGRLLLKNDYYSASFAIHCSRPKVVIADFNIKPVQMKRKPAKHAGRSSTDNADFW